MDAKTVLIVEDDEDLGEALREVLHMEGYAPLIATTSADGLRLAKEHRPPVAVLDQRLPDGAGTDLLASLRRINPECICTIVTAHADLASAMAAVEGGAAHFLRKPVRPVQLLQVLSQAFETVRLREEKTRAERALFRRTTQLKALSDAANQLNAVLETPAILQVLTSSAVVLTGGAEAMAGVVVADRVLFSAHHRDGQVHPISLIVRRQEEVPGRVIDTHQPYLSNDLENELPQLREIRRQFGHQRLIGMPVLKGDGELVAYFEVCNPKTGRPFDDQDVEMLHSLADLAATSLENARLLAEQKRAQEIISRRNAEMETFVRTVSHDLKSPLVSIDGFTTFIQEDVAKQRYDRLADSAAEVRQAVDTMSRLIEDLLDFHRLGRVRPVPEAVPMTDLVRSIAKRYDRQIEQQHVTLEIQPNMPVIQADRKLMVQVFDNLLGNALKYGCTSESPQVAIGCLETDDEMRFFVKDNGPGIPPEYHAAVFELFRRLDTRTRGSGLGLAIVQRVVETLGGRAWVESEPGHGATFWGAFPRRTVQPA